MNIYFTSDWHLFHQRVIDGPSNEARVNSDRWHGARPFKSIEEMHRTIINNYCEVVTDKDHVYFLGDLTMRGPNKCGPVMEIVKKLPGIKHYVMGNHDRLAVHTYLKMGFVSVHSSVWLQDSGPSPIGLLHDPEDAESMKTPSDWTRYSAWICGHVHDDWKLHPGGRPIINAGVDVWDYRPVELIALRKELRNQGKTEN
jgi:calcineurin-like phosphoesterase family protein